MKVFISWSGPRSRLLADALREWLHDVIQSVECFCSTEDIRAGQRWNNEVNSWLGDTDFGVLCVTPENMRAPWLNFEAGALAKRINDDARVVPVTLGFAPSALEEPLKQFNGVPADKAGVLRLVKSVADVANPGVDIERAFERWWPDLETQLLEIPSSEEQVATPEPPDVAEMFTDIMSSIRGLSSDVRHNYGGGRVSASEYQEIALALIENEGLREDVAKKHPGAINYLRNTVRRRHSGRGGPSERSPFEAALLELKHETIEAEVLEDGILSAEAEAEDRAEKRHS